MCDIIRILVTNRLYICVAFIKIMYKMEFNYGRKSIV